MEEVTSENFLNLFQINLPSVAISERKIVEIWEYEEVKKVTSGERVGENDLELNKHKR